MKYFIYPLIFLVCFYSQQTFSESPDSDKPDSITGVSKNQMALLSQKAFMPTLLPIILKNRQQLELTEEQKKLFFQWRDAYYKQTIDIMAQIVQKHIAFKKLALKPEGTKAELLKIQQEIFDLHRKVLEMKLECRENIVNTFTEEQWDNFNFILSEHPTIFSYIE
jgi:hypothetical protein